VSVSQKGKSIAASIKETQLYAPVKAYFTALGYEVKGEVGAADLVAVPKGMPDGCEPIIVELKTSFSLTLFHQAINRQSISDQVYIAVPRKSGKTALVAVRRNKMLCRRLGIGLITEKTKTPL